MTGPSSTRLGRAWVSRLHPRPCSASAASAMLAPPPPCMSPDPYSSHSPSSFLLSLSLPQSPRHHHGITAEQETQRDSPTSSLLACLGAQAPASQKLTTPFPSPFYPVFLLTEVVAQCCAEGEKNGVQVPHRRGLLGLPSMAMSIPVSFSASFSLTVH